MVTELAEHRYKLENIVGTHVGTGFYSLLFESLGGHFANAPDTVNRHFLQKAIYLLRCHHVLTIGLIEIARNFGDELVGRYPCRNGYTDSVGHALADLLCNQGRAAMTARAL